MSAVADAALESAKILIVDDEEPNVRLLEAVLRRAGYTDLRSTSDPRQVISQGGAVRLAVPFVIDD